MTVRVIAAGLDEGQIVMRLRAALRDDDVTSVVIHKAGSQFEHDRREVIVERDGTWHPLEEPSSVVATC